MNRKRSYRNRNISASFVAFGAILCSHLPLVVAQSGSTDTSNTLAAREQELKRKEAELLRSMGMTTDSSLNSDRSKSDTSPSVAVDSSKTSRPNAGIDNAPVVNQAVAVQEDRSDDQALETLRAIENHPALQGKKKPSPTTLVNSGTITTHRSIHSKNEGTAKKLDTFRRVDRDRSYVAENGEGRASSRLVSLAEIELEASRRPAPIADPSTATIGVTPAKLRSGPSSTHTSLGSLSKYSEVTIDYRSGDWYRVKTTNGQRGWVRGQTLMFDAGIPPTSTVRIGAVRAEPGSKIPR